jgi:uncharacterized tellurite resistance protein B-like protein
MIRALEQFLHSLTAPADEQRSALSTELATAILLVEAMRADMAAQPAERAAILELLQQRFGLDAAAVQELLRYAEEKSARANDFFTFTSVLNERLSHEQKIEVIELMWRVAFVDASADAGESHIISKVAGLLHVTHGEYIAAKMRVQEDARPAGG